MNPNSQTVARQFVEHLAARNVEALAGLYADDAIVWRNFDNKELNKAQTVKVLGFLCAKVDALAYKNVRVQPTSNGYVQQHVLTGVAPNGTEFSAHACLVVKLRDAQIVRIDEYIDGAQLQPLLG